MSPGCSPNAETTDVTIAMKPTPEPEVLAGLVERVTYHHAENQYRVLRAKARAVMLLMGRNWERVVTGYMRDRVRALVIPIRRGGQAPAPMGGMGGGRQGGRAGMRAVGSRRNHGRFLAAPCPHM